MGNIINICLSCDDNYSEYAGVVIASVLANAKPTDEPVFYILDGGISNKHKQEILTLKNIKDCEIKFVKINEDSFDSYKKVKSHQYVTLATYYRLKLPTLLPHVSKIIYLDCDVIVQTSLYDLFNFDLKGYPIAGVHDIKKHIVKDNPSYVNAGMLVVDLKRVVELNLEQKFLEYTKKHIDTIKVGDQEIINEVCKGNILILEDEWNVQSSNFTNRSSYTKYPKIIHFTAKKKPWHYGSFSYHRDLYFKYLQLTPWKLNEKDYKHWTKDNQRDSLIEYIKYRPIFFLRPRFYVALYKTFLKKQYPPKDVKILVAYHKKDHIYNSEKLVPIHCGRSVAFEKTKDGKISQEEFNWLLNNTIGDDTGDNISNLNRTLNEMTAIYWAWKNYDKLGNPDYIGLNHYRRYFEINYGKLDEILSKFDFIKQKHSISKQSFYDIWLNLEDRDNNFIDNSIQICKEVNPENGRKIEKFLKGNIHRGFCNMFIMKKEDFFKYCEFIFPIVLKLPQEVTYGRQAGYFAELLTSYYLYEMSKKQKAFNTSIVSYYEESGTNFIKDKIFSIKREDLSAQSHIIVKFLGLKLKLKIGK